MSNIFSKYEIPTTHYSHIKIPTKVGIFISPPSSPPMAGTSGDTLRPSGVAIQTYNSILNDRDGLPPEAPKERRVVELGGIEPPSGKTSRFHLFQAHSCFCTLSRLEQEHIRDKSCLIAFLIYTTGGMKIGAHKYSTRLPTSEHIRTDGCGN